MLIKLFLPLKTNWTICGYDSNTIVVDTSDDYEINKVHISNITRYKDRSINAIEIDFNKNKSDSLSNEEKDDIKKYLHDTYNVDIDNINILWWKGILC